MLEKRATQEQRRAFLEKMESDTAFAKLWYGQAFTEALLDRPATVFKTGKTLWKRAIAASAAGILLAGVGYAALKRQPQTVSQSSSKQENKEMDIKVATATAAAVLALQSEAQTKYWFDPSVSGNPVWDYETANWREGSATGTLTTWPQNGNGWVVLQGTQEIIVQDAGVSARLIQARGNATLRGGPVNLYQQLSLDDVGTLNVYNEIAVTNSAGKYQPFYQTGKLNIYDGGSVYVGNCQLGNNAKSFEQCYINVYTGGVFSASAFVNQNAYTMALRFDGGTFHTRLAGYTSFEKSKIFVGPGGMNVTKAEGDPYVPCPINTENGADGGVKYTGTASGAFVIRKGWYQNAPTNTYTGPTTIESTANVNIGFDQSFGAVPEEPTNNILVKANASLVAENAAEISPNRDIVVDADKQLSFYVNGERNSWTVRGTFSGSNPAIANNGRIRIARGSEQTNAPTFFSPEEDRTNSIGRFTVADYARAGIGSGVTLATSDSQVTGDNAPLYIGNYARFSVTGGLFKTTATNNRYVPNRGEIVVSGGLLDLSVNEILNAYGNCATVKVCNSGILKVGTIRLAGDNATLYNDPTKNVIDLDGGTLWFKSKIWLCNADRKGTVNFNGGVLYYDPPVTTNASTGATDWIRKILNTNKSGQQFYFYVKEGGMVVSNILETWTDNSSAKFLHGTPEGTIDGGVTKWGSGVFAMMNTGHTFNGPITVMQGEFCPNSNLTEPYQPVVLRIASGARYRSNSTTQTFRRVEGGGRVVTASYLTFSEAIAPVWDGTPQTLTIEGGVPAFGDNCVLEISGNADAASCVYFKNGTPDLSRLALKINDITAFSKKQTYVIAQSDEGFSNFFSSTNVPEGWSVRKSNDGKQVLFSFNQGTVVLLLGS